MNPLESRSLPTGFWRYAPQALSEMDERWHQRAMSSAENFPIFWSWVQYFTANPWGIAITFLVLIGISGFWLKLEWARIDIRRLALRFVLFVLALGFSDLVASLLKVIFGRLKPHVNFYNPAVLPALSLPSNHAFNCAFLVTLLHALAPKRMRKTNPYYFVFLYVLVVFVAISRIFLGQHYPIDVLAGLILGWALARLLARYYNRIPVFSKR